MFKKIQVAMDFSPAWPQLRQRLLTLREWGHSGEAGSELVAASSEL